MKTGIKLAALMTLAAVSCGGGEGEAANRKLGSAVKAKARHRRERGERPEVHDVA